MAPHQLLWLVPLDQELLDDVLRLDEEENEPPDRRLPMVICRGAGRHALHLPATALILLPPPPLIGFSDRFQVGLPGSPLGSLGQGNRLLVILRLEPMAGLRQLRLGRGLKRFPCFGHFALLSRADLPTEPLEFDSIRQRRLRRFNLLLDLRGFLVGLVEPVQYLDALSKLRLELRGVLPAGQQLVHFLEPRHAQAFFQLEDAFGFVRRSISASHSVRSLS